MGAKNFVGHLLNLWQINKSVHPRAGMSDVMESKHQGMSEAVLMMIPQHGKVMPKCLTMAHMGQYDYIINLFYIDVC